MTVQLALEGAGSLAAGRPGFKGIVEAAAEASHRSPSLGLASGPEVKERPLQPRGVQPPWESVPALASSFSVLRVRVTLDS